MTRRWPAIAASAVAVHLGRDLEEFLAWARGFGVEVGSDICPDDLLDAAAAAEPGDPPVDERDAGDALYAMLRSSPANGWTVRRCPDLDPAGNVIEVSIDQNSFVVGAPTHARAHLDVVVAARSGVPVQIIAESGCGKEHAAILAHAAWGAGELVTINCAAIPDNLFESVLFGYMCGAFYGADKAHAGLIEHASGGTLFLDEVAELPLDMQAKLLRVLQELRVRRIGENTERVLRSMQFVSATNANLVERVRRGQFREDLYYRLAGVVVTLPPLRERREEVLPLAKFFLRSVAGKALSLRAIASLQAHHWPGNIRELQRKIRRGVAFAGARIEPVHLGLPPAPCTVSTKLDARAAVTGASELIQPGDLCLTSPTDAERPARATRRRCGDELAAEARALKPGKTFAQLAGTLNVSKTTAYRRATGKK